MKRMIAANGPRAFAGIISSMLREVFGAATLRVSTFFGCVAIMRILLNLLGQKYQFFCLGTAKRMVRFFLCSYWWILERYSCCCLCPSARVGIVPIMMHRGNILLIHSNINLDVMALHVKTFRITDDASEQAATTFMQNKRISLWTAAHTADGWNLIIGYDEDRPRTLQTRPAAPVREKKEPKMEHVPDLAPEQMGLYENIRKWRNQQAREEKVKP